MTKDGENICTITEKNYNDYPQKTSNTKDSPFDNNDVKLYQNWKSIKSWASLTWANRKELVSNLPTEVNIYRESKDVNTFSFYSVR